jgi:hypothetical protein
MTMYQLQKFFGVDWLLNDNTISATEVILRRLIRENHHVVEPGKDWRWTGRGLLLSRHSRGWSGGNHESRWTGIVSVPIKFRTRDLSNKEI